MAIELIPPSAAVDRPGEPALERGLGLIQAVALNIANMVGVGPFITIPLMLTAMHGPQATLAWVLGAGIALCDGLVWSELSAALPGSGGTYHYLKQIFGGYSWGRVIPFLFIWQFLVSGPLEIASGYVGALDYLKYILPGLEETFTRWRVPGGLAVIAAVASLALTPLLCGRIRFIGRLAIVWCVGTLITMLVIIAAGAAHFHPALLRPPADAFHLDRAWVIGLGAALRFAVYDYLGYYNICYLGDEVREPARTIPKAVVTSVVVIAVLYLAMNLSIIGVVPWKDAMQSQNIGSLFMESLFGRKISVIFTGFIIWTAIASVFALTLAYSRIPYAAAREGDFFRVFGRLDSRGRYPQTSLFTVAILTAVFCFFSLQEVIDAVVTVRILVQFVGQIVALHMLRKSRGDRAMPFRMWLYPIPSVAALIGWVFMWASSGKDLAIGLVVIASGVIVFPIWRWIVRRWPTAVA